MNVLFSDIDWSILPVHTVIEAKFVDGERDFRLMWRGYGRFTNLTTGSEWFVEHSQTPIRKIKIPAFTIGG